MKKTIIHVAITEWQAVSGTALSVVLQATGITRRRYNLAKTKLSNQMGLLVIKDRSGKLWKFYTTELIKQDRKGNKANLKRHIRKV